MSFEPFKHRKAGNCQLTITQNVRVREIRIGAPSGRLWQTWVFCRSSHPAVGKDGTEPPDRWWYCKAHRVVRRLPHACFFSILSQSPQKSLPTARLRSCSIRSPAASLRRRRPTQTRPSASRRRACRPDGPTRRSRATGPARRAQPRAASSDDGDEPTPEPPAAARSAGQGRRMAPRSRAIGAGGRARQPPPDRRRRVWTLAAQKPVLTKTLRHILRHLVLPLGLAFRRIPEMMGHELQEGRLGRRPGQGSAGRRERPMPRDRRGPRPGPAARSRPCPSRARCFRVSSCR